MKVYKGVLPEWVKSLLSMIGPLILILLGLLMIWLVIPCAW